MTTETQSDVRRFTTRELHNLLGLSYRKIQWWSANHMLGPVYEGHRRLFTYEDIFRARCLLQIRELGIGMRKASAIVNRLQRRRWYQSAMHEESSAMPVIAAVAFEHTPSLYLADSAGEVLRWVSKQRRACAILFLSEYRDEIIQGIDRFAPEKARPAPARKAISQSRFGRIEFGKGATLSGAGA